MFATGSRFHRFRLLRIFQGKTRRQLDRYDVGLRPGVWEKNVMDSCTAGEERMPALLEISRLKNEPSSRTLRVTGYPDVVCLANNGGRILFVFHMDFRHFS